MARAKSVKKEYSGKVKKEPVKVKRLESSTSVKKSISTETQQDQPTGEFKKTIEGAIIFDPFVASTNPVEIKVEEEIKMECYSEAGGVCIRKIEKEDPLPRDYNKAIQTQQTKIVAKIINGCLCLVPEEE